MNRINEKAASRGTPSIWRELPVEYRPKIRYWLPAAAMDETDLRTEIRELQRRGFGGIEIVVLERLSPAILHSEEGWGRKNWDKMVKIIADETERLGMSLDIANGPGWPVSSPAIASADTPGALYELTWGEHRILPGERYTGFLPKRRSIRPEGSPELVHALAWLEKENKVLAQGSYLDLMPCVERREEGAFLDYSFPENPEGGTWILFAFYGQPAGQKTSAGQYYVIDHLSREGSAACEAYWKEILQQQGFPKSGFQADRTDGTASCRAQ